MARTCTTSSAQHTHCQPPTLNARLPTFVLSCICCHLYCCADCLARTWCLLRSSADKGALMSFRRTLDGAEK